MGINDIQLRGVSIEYLGDGYFSGTALMRVPMLNNIKIGASFDKIKIAEGGCVVEGEISTEGMDVGLLNAELRAKVQQIYEQYNSVLNFVEENAEGVAKVYNNLAELLSGTKKEAKKLLDKVTSNKPLTKNDLNGYLTGSKEAESRLVKSLELFDKRYPKTTDPELLAKRLKLSQAKDLLNKCNDCVAGLLGNAPATEPKGKGGVTELPADPDCFSGVANMYDEGAGKVATSVNKTDDELIDDYLEGQEFEDDNPCLGTADYYKGLQEGFNASWSDLYSAVKSLADLGTYKKMYQGMRILTCPPPCSDPDIFVKQAQIYANFKILLNSNIHVLDCIEQGRRTGKLFTDILAGEGLAAASSRGLKLLGKAAAKVKIKVPIEKSLDKLANSPITKTEQVVIKGGTGVIDDVLKVQNISKTIPSKWKKLGTCKQYASDLKSKMTNAGIKGEELTMKTARFIESNKFGIISTDGTHKAIQVGDMVFDNLRPLGIKYVDWIEDLGGKTYTNLPHAIIEPLNF